MNSAQPLRVYSRSAIAAASCLKRFHEIHDLGLEDDSDESRRGTAFHHIALEQYVPALVRAGVPRDRQLLDQAFRAGVVSTQCPPHLLDEVERLVFRWGKEFELDLAAFLLAEERQVVGRVSWKPDLVFAYRLTPRGSVLRIRDLKTYFAILSEEAVRADLQPQIYVWQAMQMWPGFDVYEFEMEFVRYGPDARVAVTYTADELDSLERKVQAAIALIEEASARGDWPAQPGDHCGYCRLTCDAADDPRCLDRRAESHEEAAVVLGRVLVLQRLLANDLAMLRAFATTEGPVVQGNIEYAHRRVERVRYPAAAVIDVLQKHAFPIPPDLSVSKSALASVLQRKGVQRRNPEMVAAIQQLGITKVSTKFSAKRVGDVGPETESEEES